MKSMHVIGSRKLGGAESFFVRLVLGLQETGQEVVAVDRARSLVARELADRVEQFHAPMASRWDLWSRWKIAQAIRHHRPDVVQTYMTRATVLTHVPRDARTVHVARLGGYYKVARFRHAHAWIGNTRGICDFLVDGGLPAGKVFHIGNFVGEPEPADADRLQALRQALGIPPDALVITALGRLVRKKGFDVLLQALAQLPSEAEGRPVHLVIAGDGKLRAELAAQAARLPGPARVHWTGWQTRTGPYYDLADVFVCPSRLEPLGNVILEAWAHGKPVVSTATAGALELVAPGDDGLLVPVGDAAALGQALRQCLLDAGLRAQLGQAGRLKVRRQFGKTAIVGQYVDLYRRLTGQ
jgi:glycosyltransferase involved in cell wall biosynthesis